SSPRGRGLPMVRSGLRAAPAAPGPGSCGSNDVSLRQSFSSFCINIQSAGLKIICILQDPFIRRVRPLHSLSFPSFPGTGNLIALRGSTVCLSKLLAHIYYSRAMVTGYYYDQKAVGYFGSGAEPSARYCLSQRRERDTGRSPGI